MFGTSNVSKCSKAFKIARLSFVIPSHFAPNHFTFGIQLYLLVHPLNIVPPLFMLFLVSTSVKKTNVRKRILFNIIIVAFGFMASFYVSSKTIVFGYTEISENYFSKILIIVKQTKNT